MGVDYTIVCKKAELYLDRAYPIRNALCAKVPLEADVFGTDLLTSEDLRNFIKHNELDPDDRYGPGWLEAVANWLDRFGPGRLLDDHQHWEKLGAIHDLAERGEFGRYDMIRPDGKWTTFQRKTNGF